MSSFTRRVSLGLAVLSALSFSYGASLAIGLVVTNGSLQIDHASVRGSATLFDGNLIETNTSSSQLQLKNGATLRLASETRARVYTSRLVLERGIGQLESPNYPIEAGGLHVETDAAGGNARVKINQPNQVVVAVRDGGVNVSNSRGVLIARLDKGHEMTFEPQENASTATTRVSGILALKSGKFVLVDRVTNVTLQVQGSGLEAEVGNLVEISGTVNSATPTVAGASQVIDVSSVKRLTESARAAGAEGNGGPAPKRQDATGISTRATVAIVGGVAAVFTVGGLAAAQALPGQGSKPPSISR